MGWFEAGAKLTLGDTPLDLLRRALVETSAEYREALERPPTLEELQELLRIVLAGADDSMIAGLEQRQVSAVKLSTKAAPKKQNWKAGDCFAIPLPDGTFGFGRVLSRVRDQITFAEIFRARGKGPIPPPGFKESGRLFYPIAISGVIKLEKGVYRIFERDPAFRAPDHEALRFYSKGSKTAHLMGVEYNTIDRDLPLANLPEQASDLDDYRNDAGKLDKLARDVQRLLDEAKIEPS